MEVKTRFAPSPTGDLHLGGARTALFAWLFARHHKGKFVLRIEDTDRERSTQESVNVILAAMAWLGLDYDEGPYYQTERMQRYQEVLEQLLADNKAYRCTCSKERLDKLRQEQMQSGEKPRYDGHCRDKNIGADESSYVVRFRQPHAGEMQFHDLIRGDIVVSNSELDDMILARSDGSPTYNFTVVVDDGDMGITHVLRGDDHINNTPRQLHLLQTLGYTKPHYGHMPSILGAGGKRLSKRHGAQGVLAYRDQGYLPAAMLNYLCRLGWSHGDQEIFSLPEMQKLFDITAVQKSPAAFSEEKLLWFNQYYITAAASESLLAILSEHLLELGINQEMLDSGPNLADVVALQQSRCKTIRAMAEQSLLFYHDLPAYDGDLVGKSLTPAALPLLQACAQAFSNIEVWQAETIHAMLTQIVAEHAVGFAKVGKPLRAAVTGGIASGALPQVVSLLGQQEVIDRIHRAMSWVESNPSSG